MKYLKRKIYLDCVLFDMFKFMQFFEIHFKGGDADDDEWLPLPDDDAFELEW